MAKFKYKQRIEAGRGYGTAPREVKNAGVAKAHERIPKLDACLLELRFARV